MVKDPLGLAQVQLGVHGYDGEAGPPGPVQDLEISRMVAHEERDPIARLQPGGAKRGSQPGGALRQAAVVMDKAIAFVQGRPPGVGQRDALQGLCEVHAPDL